jgi:peptidoglycan/xylan/chitin deacetylase (PgdA/CDA1 family)
VKHRVKSTFLRDVFQKTTLLGAVLLILSVVTYKAFTFVEFYTIARGTGRIVHSLRKYECEGPGTLTEDYDSADSTAKSYDVERLQGVVLGNNLVPNSEFGFRSSENVDLPGAYTMLALNTDKVEFAYSHAINQPDNSYVHVSLNEDGQERSATWLPELAEVTAGNPYLATFVYRSDVNLNVTVEQVMADEQSNYVSLGLIEPTTQWKTFHTYWVPDPGTVKARLYLAVERRGSADITKQELRAIPPRPLASPIISVNFDDGWESVATVGDKYFDKYGIKTTQYVVASYVDNEKAYMTKDQLKMLQSKGHEVGAHSLKHCNMAKLSMQDLEYDTRVSKEILTRNYGEMSSYAHPYGAYSDDTLNLLGKSFPYLRSTTTGFNDHYFDPHNIKVQNVKLETSLDEIQGWIKQAVDNKQWLVLVYHKVDTIDDFGISEENFDKQMGMIKNSGAQTLTMRDAIKTIESQYDFTPPQY